jgi:hypothetical protein
MTNVMVMIEIKLSVQTLMFANGQIWYAIQKMTTGKRTEYWSNGMGWNISCAYCTLYPTTESATTELQRLFG